MLKRTIFSLSLLLVTGCTAAQQDEYGEELTDDKESNIVGGANANIADHPWQISFQTSGGSHFCGGSIIAPQWILTAQHCVEGSSAASVRIAAGASQLSQMSSSGQIRNVDEIIPYPGYTDPSAGKDVALLHLTTPLTLGGNVQAIALASPSDASAGLTNAGVTANVSGWGTLSSGGSSPNTLQAVNVPIVSNATADAAYPESITADQLAAGDMVNGGEDSCQGDSGGPFTVAKGSSRILAGVVSWGYGCADKQYPGMYARVSSFHDWINGHVSAPAATPVVLDNQANQSGAVGSWKHIAITVPANATKLVVQMSGGTGDADLYVRRSSQPTTSLYDCRPYLGGNNESCTFNSPAAGTWYVSINGYTAYSGVTVTSTGYTTGAPPPAENCTDGTDNDGDAQADCADSDCSAHPSCAPPPAENCTDGIDNDGDAQADCADADCSAHPSCAPDQPETFTASNVSVNQYAWKDYLFNVTAGTSLNAVMTKLSGNPDLYVRWTNLPTTSTYSCRPYLAGNETCTLTVPAGVTQAYVSVRGRNGGSNTFNVSVTYTP